MKLSILQFNVGLDYANCGIDGKEASVYIQYSPVWMHSDGEAYFLFYFGYKTFSSKSEDDYEMRYTTLN